MAKGLTALDVTDDGDLKDYFWLHRIFADLLRTDPTIAQIWASGPLIKADASHYLQRVGLLSPATAEVEFHIRNKLTNVYKLNRRIELPPTIEGTVLGALFKTCVCGEMEQPLCKHCQDATS